MHMNIIGFPAAATAVHTEIANDDRPAGPGGNVVSISEFRRRARMIRTLRGVFFVAGGTGAAQAA